MILRLTVAMVLLVVNLTVESGANALAIPAATNLGPLAFSTEIEGNGQPIGQATNFPSNTPRVWVSFDYNNYSPGSTLSYIARADGSDYQSSNLGCCGGSQGRYAFPIVPSEGGNLPGAAYEVFVYEANQQIGQGSFGVEGTGGFDDDDNDNESDEDGDGDDGEDGDEDEDNE